MKIALFLLLLTGCSEEERVCDAPLKYSYSCDMEFSPAYGYVMTCGYRYKCPEGHEHVLLRATSTIGTTSTTSTTSTGGK